jgi:outer membrane protein assembly factor BamB
VVCIDPRTGNAVWTIGGTGQHGGDTAMAVYEDYLVCRVGAAPAMGCFRLSAAGGKKLWSLPDDWRPAQPLLYRGHAFLRGPSGMKCVELASGKVTYDKPTVGRQKFIGTLTAADGRIFLERDSHHNLNDMDFLTAEANGPRPLGATWVPPHPNQGSYVTTMIHPYVDGRLFMRGYNGVYCYDLRKPTGRAPKAS